MGNTVCAWYIRTLWTAGLLKKCGTAGLGLPWRGKVERSVDLLARFGQGKPCPYGFFNSRTGSVLFKIGIFQ